MKSLILAQSLVSPVAVPEKSKWESNMINYGHIMCDAIANTTWIYEKQGLNSIYYDGMRVYRQIAAYDTANAAYWNNCAQKAEAVYRDYYIATDVPQGFWLFTHGLRLDFERTGDLASRNAAQYISLNSPFASDYACCPAPDGYNPACQGFSREVAYAINSYMDTEDLGYPKRKNKDLYAQNS